MSWNIGDSKKISFSGQNLSRGFIMLYLQLQKLLEKNLLHL